MTLPSFTADRALYAPGRRYHMGALRGAAPGDLVTMQYWCADCWCPDHAACFVQSYPDGTQTCKCVFGGGSSHVADARTLLRA